MSIHINATAGQIASMVLLPGDPLRAKTIAENLLENPVLFNETRGMLGFTGEVNGRKVSVMGTGMGIPSISIYVNELIREYGVHTLIRVGTCGALQPQMRIGDLVLAMAASTNSRFNQLHFENRDFAPVASFSLLQEAYGIAQSQKWPVHVGGVLTSDTFYETDPDWWKIWATHGVLAADMETSALYTLAARHGVRALSILTVSDQVVTGEVSSTADREHNFLHMAKLALSLQKN